LGVLNENLAQLVALVEHGNTVALQVAQHSHGFAHMQVLGLGTIAGMLTLGGWFMAKHDKWF
jgi:sulfite exporter TauE/SafE